MKSLEKLIVCELVGKKAIQNNHSYNEEISLNEKGEWWIYFELDTETKDRKSYKKNITFLVNKHEGLENMLDVYIATEMIREGYFLVPIEGGWVVHGGSEPYQLQIEECTCRAYIQKPSQPCKHLRFLNFHLRYRNECNKIKHLYK